MLRFHGHYHGWFDNIQIRSDGERVLPGSLGQVADALDPALTIEWNDPEAFTAAVHAHGDTVAAVVMEPMMLNAKPFLKLGCSELALQSTTYRAPWSRPQPPVQDRGIRLWAKAFPPTPVPAAVRVGPQLLGRTFPGSPMQARRTFMACRIWK